MFEGFNVHFARTQGELANLTEVKTNNFLSSTSSRCKHSKLI